MKKIKFLLLLTFLACLTMMSCNSDKAELNPETENNNNNNNNNNDRYTYEIELSLDGESVNFSKLDDRHTSFKMYKDGMELSFRTDEEKYKQLTFFIYSENPLISNATDFEVIDASKSKSYGQSIMNYLSLGGFSGFSCGGSLQVTKSTPQEIIFSVDANLFGIEDVATGLCPNNLKGQIMIKTSYEREIINVNLIN